MNTELKLFTCLLILNKCIITINNNTLFIWISKCSFTSDSQVFCSALPPDMYADFISD